MADQKAHASGAVIVRYVAASDLTLWSMDVPQRLRRQFARVGITEVAPWDGTPVAECPHIILRADQEYAPVLLADLVDAPGTVLTNDGRPVAAHVPANRAREAAEELLRADILHLRDLRVVAPGQLSSSHNKALRKREAPYVIALTPDSLDAIERRTFEGSYKGVTDVITRHVWPAPARAVTRLCAKFGITPNMVTTLSLVLVLWAMWLFWIGQFWPGLLAAWAMTFLDTVDGKLARVTLNTSPFGNVFDHGIDLIHPPFWYWAWYVGLGLTSPVIEAALWVIIAGYILQRVQEGIFIARFGLEMHVWRRFDSRFRLIVARRNPNLVLLTFFMIASAPVAGFLAVALWTLVGFIVHCVQTWQAFRAPKPITSWLAQ